MKPLKVTRNVSVLSPICELIHPKLSHRNGRAFRRQAVRGIVMHDDKLLLLFTERYNDFSLPGGGVEPDEDFKVALKRELAEETGARDVTVQRYYGHIEEYRPYWKPDFDLMHMTSHFYVCDATVAFEQAQMDSHEIANGMQPLWVPILQALAHNRQVLARTEASMGLSIHRETFMLEKIASEFLT